MCHHLMSRHREHGSTECGRGWRYPRWMWIFGGSSKHSQRTLKLLTLIWIVWEQLRVFPGFFIPHTVSSNSERGVRTQTLR